jgi:hypothetical protein
MRTRVLSVLALLIAGLVSVVPTSPAQADFFGASVRHRWPDAGRHPAIRVQFANGDMGRVAVGGHSDHLQPNGQEDVAYIYVHRCDLLMRQYAWDPTGGWHIYLRGNGPDGPSVWTYRPMTDGENLTFVVWRQKRKGC